MGVFRGALAYLDVGQYNCYVRDEWRPQVVWNDPQGEAGARRRPLVHLQAL